MPGIVLGVEDREANKTTSFLPSRSLFYQKQTKISKPIQLKCQFTSV